MTVGVDPVELFKQGAPFHELVAVAKKWREQMKVKLIRYDEDKDGTFGVLLIDGKAFCSTLEPVDRDNRANVSCIPGDAIYKCEAVESPRYGKTFEVVDVPGRSHILFHAGNFAKDTKGCILLGEHEGKLFGDRAVLNSGKTFAKFLKKLPPITGFTLEIVEAAKLAKNEAA